MKFPEFAEYSGVSRQGVWQAVKKGLLFATDGMIDTESPSAKAYTAAKRQAKAGGRPPKPPRAVEKKVNIPRPPPPKIHKPPEPASIPEPEPPRAPLIMDAQTHTPEIEPYVDAPSQNNKPTLEIQFSDSPAFAGFSKTEMELQKIQQQVVALKLKNSETLGNLISREKVERLIFQPINVAHHRILTDGSKTISAHIHPLILGGATVEEVEAYVRKQISGFFKAAKRDMQKVISDAGD